MSAPLPALWHTVCLPAGYTRRDRIVSATRCGDARSFVSGSDDTAAGKMQSYVRAGAGACMPGVTHASVIYTSVYGRRSRTRSDRVGGHAHADAPGGVL